MENKRDVFDTILNIMLGVQVILYTFVFVGFLYCAASEKPKPPPPIPSSKALRVLINTVVMFNNKTNEKSQMQADVIFEACDSDLFPATDQLVERFQKVRSLIMQYGHHDCRTQACLSDLHPRIETCVLYVELAKRQFALN